MRNWFNIKLKYQKLLVVIKFEYLIQFYIISIYHNSRWWCHCCKKVHPLNVTFRDKILIDFFQEIFFLFPDMNWATRGQSYHKTPSNSYLGTKKNQEAADDTKQIVPVSNLPFSVCKADFELGCKWINLRNLV